MLSTIGSVASQSKAKVPIYNPPSLRQSQQFSENGTVSDNLLSATGDWSESSIYSFAQINTINVDFTNINTLFFNLSFSVSTQQNGYILAEIYQVNPASLIKTAFNINTSFGLTTKSIDVSNLTGLVYVRLLVVTETRYVTVSCNIQEIWGE